MVCIKLHSVFNLNPPKNSLVGGFEMAWVENVYFYFLNTDAIFKAIDPRHHAG